MNDTIPKKWVGGICIKDGKVLLIYRINKDRLFQQEYFVFPGKEVSEDESISDALTDEFKKLSISIHLKELLHMIESDLDDDEEHYYLCDHVLGEPVQQPLEDNESQKQYFVPMWVSLHELDDMIVYPETVKEVILDTFKNE